MAKKAEKFPLNICVDLTYRCPARCGFCFLRKSGQLNGGSKELSAARLENIFGALPPRRNFYLTGGEPFARKDTAEIVRMIKSRGHYAMLTTNGLLLSARDLAALFSAELDALVVSLHGGRERHDAALGVPGAFDKVRKLASVFEKMRGRIPTRLELWCTINPDNYDNLSETAREMAALRPDAVNFNHLEFILQEDWDKTSVLLGGAGLDSAANSPGRISPPEIDPSILHRETEKIRRMGIPGLRFSPDLTKAGMSRWYSGKNGLQRTGRCQGQWDSAWLSPSGEFYSCQPLAVRLGKATGNEPWAPFSGEKCASLRELLTESGGFLPACYRCGRATHSGRRASKNP